MLVKAWTDEFGSKFTLHQKKDAALVLDVEHIIIGEHYMLRYEFPAQELAAVGRDVAVARTTRLLQLKVRIARMRQGEIPSDGRKFYASDEVRS